VRKSKPRGGVGAVDTSRGNGGTDSRAKSQSGARRRDARGDGGGTRGGGETTRRESVSGETMGDRGCASRVVVVDDVDVDIITED